MLPSVLPARADVMGIPLIVVQNRILACMTPDLFECIADSALKTELTSVDLAIHQDRIWVRAHQFGRICPDAFAIGGSKAGIDPNITPNHPAQSDKLLAKCA
jgi:hypothetical protein